MTVTSNELGQQNIFAKEPPIVMTDHPYGVPPKYLHLVARYVDGQWIVACLDFDLAAQDDTFEDAQKRLMDQVHSYVEKALAMDGGKHAEQLLNRKAPLSNWVLFYVGMMLGALHAAQGLLQGYQRPFQLQAA